MTNKPMTDTPEPQETRQCRECGHHEHRHLEYPSRRGMCLEEDCECPLFKPSPREPQKDETVACLWCSEAMGTAHLDPSKHKVHPAPACKTMDEALSRIARNRMGREPREPHAALIAAAMETLEKALERGTAELRPRHAHLIYEAAIRKALQQFQGVPAEKVK